MANNKLEIEIGPRLEQLILKALGLNCDSSPSTVEAEAKPAAEKKKATRKKSPTADAVRKLASEINAITDDPAIVKSAIAEAGLPILKDMSAAQRTEAFDILTKLKDSPPAAAEEDDEDDVL